MNPASGDTAGGGLADRLVASDPGLARLRVTLTTVLTLGVSLGVLYGVTHFAFLFVGFYLMQVSCARSISP